MFQSVHDYPYLSSSANHIFDITVGVSTKSKLYSSITQQQAKKKNIYNSMALQLVGTDVTGSIMRFDVGGNANPDTGTKMDDVVFVNLARILSKDEIKKGSFQMDIGVNQAHKQDTSVNEKVIRLQDSSGSDGFFRNSPAGEYGVLFATGAVGTDILPANQSYAVGLLYYQAGIAVISGSVFNSEVSGGVLHNTNTKSTEMITLGGPEGFKHVTGSTISTTSTALRTRMKNLQFNNTVELNSTIYFCRVNHNEFNYSTNPTYMSGSKIRVKEKQSDPPVSYITSVGLYNDNNELLAVAKLSEPLKKDPSNEFTLRVRLDY